MKKRNFSDPPYKRWRKAVLKRDKNKCQWPGCKCKHRLQIHHIRPWSKTYAMRYMISNGIALCWAHHNHIRGKEHLYERMFKTIIWVNIK